MRSDALRPDGWTSADAAGLPILPGLARYDEVARGRIRPRAAIYGRDDAARVHLSGPALRERLHLPDLPPMGLRMRLEGHGRHLAVRPQARVILRALQVYGMILADNGSSMYVTGAPAPGWDDDDLPRLAPAARQRLRGRRHAQHPTVSGRLRDAFRCPGG